MPAVHFRPDTLPRVERGAGGGLLDLVLPFRVDVDPASGTDRLAAWRLRAQVGGRACEDVTSRVVTPQVIAGLSEAAQDGGTFAFEAFPPYLAMEPHAGTVTYLEYRVRGLRPGDRVSYGLDAVGGDAGRTYTTYAVAPEFGRADIRRIARASVFEPDRAWVLYHRSTAGLHHVRIDVVTLVDDPLAPAGADGLADLVVVVGDRTVDLGRTPDYDLPLVDLASDSVVLTVPADGAAPFPAVSVRYRGGETVPVDLGATVGVGRARAMFVNFAIQGLNDYFAGPDEKYSPARTYTQVTMRDEDATFSSRPGSPEDGPGGAARIGDGYAFTLEAHRRYGIKQMWAMNGGLGILMAHDSPDDLERLREDIASGLVQPVVTGFGAHRVPYYAAETNADAIRLGAAVLDGVLGAHSAVFYPDSRVYARCPQVTDALAATGVEYVVVDADSNGNTVVAAADPPFAAQAPDGQWVDYLNLWRDRTTGTKILFIDPQMKDQLFGADEADARAGKASRSVREKFLIMAAQPDVRRDNLLVYSDDADKASGNGWFDGQQNPTPMNRNYQATLSWISRHPWVEVVTADDLTAADCVGTLDLVAACDPYIERIGTSTVPGFDFGIPFDTWYTAWAGVRVAWLGETLLDVTRRAEDALAGWPVRGRLVDLARLHVTLCLHESQWSKKARPGGSEAPEDFVVAESIQLRNAHVFLAAAVWAEWAAAARPPGAFRDAGPVVERVADLERRSDARRGTPAWRRPGAEGLQWDHDPQPCVVLYNTETLAVIDRNGGRVTHLFTVVDGRPYAVSGTFKAYQYLDVDWSSDGDAGIECDGIVLQNTVCTPNHAYVACDVDASGSTPGPDVTVEAPAADGPYRWAYPDNFNAYDVVETTDGDTPSVTFAYGPGTGEDAPHDLAGLTDLLDRDRAARLADHPGRGVVLHDQGRFGAFRKTIRLVGPAVYVSYTGVAPGHRVSNELCVDLWSSAMRGKRQARTVGPDRDRVRVANGAVAVEVALGDGCAFADAAIADLDAPDPAALRLHRVLTDDVQVVATAAAFDYVITPGRAPG